MSRKHNTKHNRSRSRYPERLAARGLSRPPHDPYGGMTTMQIQEAFKKLPHYTWREKTDTNARGTVYTYQEAQMIR